MPLMRPREGLVLGEELAGGSFFALTSVWDFGSFLTPGSFLRAGSFLMGVSPLTFGIFFGTWLLLDRRFSLDLWF